MGPGNVRRLALRWAPVLIGVTLGILGGYQLGYASTLSGLGALGAYAWFTILGLGLGVAGGVGLVARAFARSRAIGMGILRATGAALLTAIVVSLGVPLLGLGYHEPVVLHASGTATLTLTGVDSFAPRANPPAECSSEPDAQEVQRVFAPGLGKLPMGTVRASVEMLPGPIEGSGRVEMFIDGADLPDGAAQPFWNGEAVLETNADRTAGTARFRDAELTSDAGAAAAATPPLPTTLSGSITWSCEGWRDPEATIRLESPGSLRLDLPGEGLTAIGSQVATCSFEEDGSVLEVVSRGGYALRGSPLWVGILVRGRNVQGADVHVWVRAESSGKAPPPGGFVPSWGGKGSLAEVDADERTGELSFTDLPPDMDASVGDPPASWPLTISGMVAWTCE